MPWPAENCPAVNSGPNSLWGITDLPRSKWNGHIIHFDFGVKYKDYCSDIQRLVYVCAKAKRSSAEVQRAFITIRTAIEKSREAMKPGVTGNSIDVIAREILVDAGIRYGYAAGHQLGRVAHDGGALLGPCGRNTATTHAWSWRWDKSLPSNPGMAVPNYGYVALEEDVVMTERGRNTSESRKESSIDKGLRPKRTADLWSAVRFKRPNPCSYGDKLSKNKRRLFYGSCAIHHWLV